MQQGLQRIKAHPWKSFFAAVLLFGLVRIWAWYFYFPTYTPKVMTPISAQTATHCIGRYLMDLPTDMNKVTGSLSNRFYYGLDKDFKTVEFKVLDGDYTFEQFKAAVEERRKELATKTNEDLKIPLLLKAFTEPTKLYGTVVFLRYLEDESNSFSSIKTEVHHRVGNRYVLLTVESYIPQSVRAKGALPDGYIAYKDIDPLPAEERLRRISQNLRGYSDASKAGEGFCVNGVVFDNKTMGYDEEKMSERIGSTGKDSLVISVDMGGATGNDKETLFERLEKRERDGLVHFALSNPTNFRWHTLRKRELEIEGMKFQEWLEETEEDTNMGGGVVEKGQRSWKFILESVRNPKSSLHKPAIRLELSAQNDFALAQILPVWDAAVKSLRLSPANGAVATQAQTPKARAGEPCPQTGYWKAGSSSATVWNTRALEQSPALFIKQGDPMPDLGTPSETPAVRAANAASLTWWWVRA
jgi:Tle cognate immunity protein 4 C-terminal domain/Tle cognate immunity protein 4 N-terminal domain